jgi:predicted  nucleic acid-binding Zn-ribbon protein
VADLEQVLVVQAHDTAVDQLRHRRANLPQRIELDATADQLARVEAQMAERNAQRAVLAESQQRFEGEVSALDAKAEQVSRALSTGSVPRELKALQDEYDGMQRRKRLVEDHIIEVMEEIEPIDAELARLEAERTELDKRAVALLAEIAEVEADITAGLASESAARDAEAAKLPDALRDEYESLRSRLGGIGAARLTGGVCGGCRLSLSAVEVDRIRHLTGDQLVHCEECGRLLVP